MKYRISCNCLDFESVSFPVLLNYITGYFFLRVADFVKTGTPLTLIAGTLTIILVPFFFSF